MNKIRQIIITVDQMKRAFAAYTKGDFVYTRLCKS